VSRQTIEELEKIIKERKSIKISRDGDFIPAAVMLILKEERGEYFMLLIKRPESREDLFSGHMAFPGGKMKEGDRTRLDTAIRETFEETGIDLKEKGKILGELDDFNPINPRANHFVVSPYVAFLTEEAEIRPNEEVAEILWIPLSHLKDEKNLEVRTIEKHGMLVKDYVFNYRDYVIWGMTGRILYGFISLVGHLF
jgi:8-oxo-dGTP pyrophosphatase MutT (NUDIX family)